MSLFSFLLLIFPLFPSSFFFFFVLAPFPGFLPSADPYSFFLFCFHSLFLPPSLAACEYLLASSVASSRAGIASRCRVADAYLRLKTVIVRE
jgi:hypothetical protein